MTFAPNFICGFAPQFRCGGLYEDLWIGDLRIEWFDRLSQTGHCPPYAIEVRVSIDAV